MAKDIGASARDQGGSGGSQAAARRSPRRPSVVLVAVLAALLASAGFLAAPTPAAPGDPVAPPVVLTGTDRGLAWTADGAETGPAPGETDTGDDPADVEVELELGLDDELGWDLTGLAPDGVVAVEVAEVRGPGAISVAASTTTGEAVPGELDTAAGRRFVDLPTGEEGVFRWSFAQPGRYEVEVVATAATVTPEPTSATFLVTVTPDAVQDEPGTGPTTTVPPASAPPTSHPAADPGAPEATTPTPSGDGVAPAVAPRPAPRAVAPRQAPAGEQVLIDDGHVDVGPRVVDGRWRVQMKDDTVSPFTWRDLADVVLHARDAAITEVPDREAYAFLGSPGDEVYLLPQAQQQGLVWPGWNSQDPSVTAAVPGVVTWRLRSVDGPGRFVLFSTDSFGDTDVFFDSDDALPQALEIPRNSHVHGNWGFTESGVYRIGVEMSATDAGGAVLTDARTLTIVVGDEHDPQDAFTPDPGGDGTPVDPPPGGGTTPDGAGPGGSDPDGSGGGGSPGSGGPGGGSGGGGSGPGGLASTGAAGLGPQGGAGIVLVVLGAAFLLLRRRLDHGRIPAGVAAGAAGGARARPAPRR